MAGRFRDAFPILQVAEMRRSLAFYCDLLGFELTYSFPEEGEPQFVTLAVPGGTLAWRRARA